MVKKKKALNVILVWTDYNLHHRGNAIREFLMVLLDKPIVT